MIVIELASDAVTVKAWLEGSPFDLATLAGLFDAGDVRVIRDDTEVPNQYYLTAPRIGDTSLNDRFVGPATAALTQVNGFARICDPSFRPVSLSRIFTDGDGGVHVVPKPAVLHVRAGRPSVSIGGTVTAPDGIAVPPPPSPWPSRFALAETHNDVAEVLRIMSGGEPLTWSDLYKIHEIVCEGVRPNTIVGFGWTTKGEDSAFRVSANRADVSGTEARHARNPGETPTRTMSIDQGRFYISSLVEKWLDHLTAD